MIKFILLILFNIPLFQFIPWVLSAWFNSPLDKYGPLWLIAAAILFLINSKHIIKSTSTKDLNAIILLIFSSIFLTISLKLQINIFAITSAIIISLTGIWLLYGWNTFLLILPIYGILFLSLPTTTYMTMYLIGKMNLPFSINSETVKIIIGIIIASLNCIYSRQKKYHITKINGIYWCSFVLFCTLFIFYRIPSKEMSQPLNLKISTNPRNGWYGEEYSLSSIEKKIYDEKNVKKYFFYNNEGYKITVMIFTSYTDVHSLHPPDYCLSGAGWQIMSDVVGTAKFNSKKYSIRELTAKLNNTRELIFSWYSSSKMSTDDYKLFRMYQEKSTLSDWQAYLVTINIKKNSEDSKDKLLMFINNYLH